MIRSLVFSDWIDIKRLKKDLQWYLDEKPDENKIERNETGLKKK